MPFTVSPFRLAAPVQKLPAFRGKTGTTTEPAEPQTEPKPTRAEPLPIEPKPDQKPLVPGPETDPNALPNFEPKRYPTC